MIHQYWDFWWGGLAIAAVSITMVVFSGNFLSVTRGYASVCAIFTSKPYFHKPDIGGKFGFRTFFSVGLILGGLLAAITSGGYHPDFDLGSFENIWGDNLFVKAAVLITGGFLWGYGSRMAKGCTSGNAISGLSKGSLASLIATASFLVGGAALTFLIDFWSRG